MKSIPCPHCGTGTDGSTVGLSWSPQELCWACIICGYRKYRQPERHKSKAEIKAEEAWDSVLDALAAEEKSQTTRQF